MQWLEQLNDALEYLEQNLEGSIDYAVAARLACCSTYHFQRMFSYIAGVSLAEYIRRRRMTLAAFALQNGARVLEVALRFGYESPTAFNRAFQSIHGITPSAAQKQNAPLKAFARIRFHLTIKGDEEMEYRIVDKPAFRIIGLKEPIEKDLEENFRTVPLFWQRAAEQGQIPRLCALMNREPMGVLGVCDCVSDEWSYYIAVASDLPLPAGEPALCEYTVPAATWAVFAGQGSAPGGIQELEKRIFTEWLPTSGYEYASAPDIEVYLEPEPENARYEVWLPIVPKQDTCK